MGVVKNFTDELAKHTLLVYFVILWGGTMFFWSSCNLAYGSYVDILDVVAILANLLELIAGILLVISGIKLMSTNFLAGINTEKTLVYFLILWAGSFIFWGIYDIFYYGPWVFRYLEDTLCFLGGLAAFFAGVVLGLFGWRLLAENEPPTPPPTPQ
jgi:hypothetical protein